jgi:hypothetical protein
MRIPGEATSRLVCLAVAVLALGLALYGCGESGDDGAEQLAKQQELQAARAEAAQDARQGARIAELERRLKGANKRAIGSGTDSPETGPTVVEGPEGEAPLTGLWRGDAVIRYESGKSDSFVQTIELDSLVPGEVAGYSEALQNSTTCHGPLTYQGASEGWHRFSAEEQNVNECIDYSELDLMLDASGDLLYRETTDVSVSAGTLDRIQ